MAAIKSKRGAYAIIVGCGRLGADLANALSGGDVTVIDKHKDAFRKLSPAFGGLALPGDATDFDVLETAQIAKAGVVVCVTDDDNVNIMVSQMAREAYGVPRVIARLYDPDRACVYRELGIDAFCPAVLSANEIQRLLNIAPAQPAREEAGA